MSFVRIQILHLYCRNPFFYSIRGCMFPFNRQHVNSIPRLPLTSLWVDKILLPRFVNWYPYFRGLYIYIYIYNNLLNNRTYGKGKKPTSNSKIKIYNESLSREIYIYWKKKKKRPTVSHQLKKINRYAIAWSKETKHRKLLLSYKYKKCSILSRESGTNLLQFRLSCSSGYLILAYKIIFN